MSTALARQSSLKCSRCDYTGNSAYGLTVHIRRKHGQQKGIAFHDLATAIQQVLSASNGPMSRKNIVVALASHISKKNLNPDLIGSKLNVICKQHPEFGIIKKERNQYSLKPGHQVSVSPVVEHPEPEIVIPPDVELFLLREKNLKQQEVLMQLVQTVVMLVR